MKIMIKETFHPDHVTREAGEKLRKMIVSAFQKNEAIELDFLDCVIASTSFFDEGIAKLALESDQMVEKIKLLKMNHLHRRDRELLLDLCKKRKLKLDLP